MVKPYPRPINKVITVVAHKLTAKFVYIQVKYIHSYIFASHIIILFEISEQNDARLVILNLKKKN